MKILTVSALVCAMMVVTGAAESHLVKRSNFIGWTRIYDRWFRFVPQPMTWAKAEKNCQSLGGHLASIHNLQEYQEIWKVAKEPTWVGGSDVQKEGQWVWTDSSPFDYNNWCSGEPNNLNMQHCLQINYGACKCWDDLACSKVRPSLCVKKN